MDLDRYCARIGYTGPRRATLATLEALHQAHTTAIPFENLNPLVGWAVPLDAPSLERKMLEEGRGGWCFEHNWLFRRALEAIGFSVRGLAARVLWAAAPDAFPPRSHMLLQVELDGRRLMADVGFGAVTLTGPLLLSPGIEQQTPHEPFRLMPWAGRSDELVLEAKLGEWAPLYRFRLDEQFLPDYEVGSFYLCHHPSSFFRRDLVAARPFPGGRLGLRNNVLVTRRLGAEPEVRMLRTASEIRRTLTDDFLIRVPAHADVDAALERAASTPTAPPAQAPS